MTRTHIFACLLPKQQADDLNRKSGRVYTSTLVRHYRVYRKSGYWLMYTGKRVEDAIGGLTTLRAHSRNVAQEGCKLRRTGITAAHHPN
jgi:hypothetical protein